MVIKKQNKKNSKIINRMNEAHTVNIMIMFIFNICFGLI